jgi:phosphate transport system ATP-binding protein
MPSPSCVSVFYGDKQALFDVNLDMSARTGHRVDRPVRLRQVHLPALPQPDERHHPICRVTGDITLDGEDIYDPDAHRRGAAARPVGMVFQKPNPFPKSIYENIAYGPRIHGLATNSAELDEIVESACAEGRPVGTRSRTAWTSPAPACPAASSSACASPAPLPSTRRSS